MSSAFAEWVNLTPEQRDLATAAIPAWVACDRWKRGHIVNAERFLKERRWESPPPPPDPTPRPLLTAREQEYERGQAALRRMINGGVDEPDRDGENLVDPVFRVLE